MNFLNPTPKCILPFALGAFLCVTSLLSFQVKPKKVLFVSTEKSRKYEIKAFQETQKQTKQKRNNKNGGSNESVSDSAVDSTLQQLYHHLSKLPACDSPPCTYTAELCVGDNRDDCHGGVRPPIPCPVSHCADFLRNKVICFYSEADQRPVQVYMNNVLIGKATDVSFDSKLKLRTVSLKQGIKNTKKVDVLRLEIPVTYKEEGRLFQDQLSITTQF